MGASSSSCDASIPVNPAFAGMPASARALEEEVKRINYLKLMQPTKYEELQRETYMALKWESFEGLKFDITKPLNPNFYVSHRLLLGSMEVPAGQPQVLKTPHSEYNYGATVATEKMLLLGQISANGTLTSRMQGRFNDTWGIKVESRMSNEQGGSMQVMGDLEGGGGDWLGQVKLGTAGFYGANYMQSITPTLSAGGELFYLSHGCKSGAGAALRHANEKCIATMQLATTGILCLTYFHKINAKAHVATDFLWNLNAKEATASLGYDYHFHACRLRGSISSDGKIAACLEEKMGPGVSLILSAELDHAKMDHKFGFGMTVGE